MSYGVSVFIRGGLSALPQHELYPLQRQPDTIGSLRVKQVARTRGGIMISARNRKTLVR